MKKSMKIIVPVLASVAVVVAVVLVATMAVIPSMKYKDALEFIQNGDYEQAVTYLSEIDGYKDANEKLSESKYMLAQEYQKTEDYAKAAILYGSISGYKDSREKSMAMWQKTGVVKTVSVCSGEKYTTAVKNDGTVAVVFPDLEPDWAKPTANWTDISSVYSDDKRRIGVKTDGTIVALASTSKEADMINGCGWTDIVKVEIVKNSRYEVAHILGLKIDGTIAVLHMDECYKRCKYKKFEEMTDVADISVTNNSYVVLKSDGTVVPSESSNDYGELDVAGWTDIVAIAHGDNHTVGVKKDGTVVAVGKNDRGQCSVSEWTDIKSIAVNDTCTLGVREDGTVVSAGDSDNSIYASAYKVNEWTDIADVFIADDYFAAGLKSDGTIVLALGNSSNTFTLMVVEGWTDIKVPEN